jgi:protein CpxP
MARVFNNRILLFIIAVLLISNIVMLVLWYRWTHEDHRWRGGEMSRSPMSVFLEKKVGFSAQQMTAFEQLRKDHREKLKPMFEQLKDAKSGFFKLVTAPDISDSQMMAESRIIAERQQALDIQTVKNFRQLRNLCTEQQRPIYDSLMPGIISEMWFPNRRGPRPGGNGNPPPSRP